MDLVESPIIQTERLLIRNLDISYIKNVFSYRSLPSVAKFQSFKPKNLADMEVFLVNLLTASIDQILGFSWGFTYYTIIS